MQIDMSQVLKTPKGDPTPESDGKGGSVDLTLEMICLTVIQSSVPASVTAQLPEAKLTEDEKRNLYKAGIKIGTAENGFALLKPAEIAVLQKRINFIISSPWISCQATEMLDKDVKVESKKKSVAKKKSSAEK